MKLLSKLVLGRVWLLSATAWAAESPLAFHPLPSPTTAILRAAAFSPAGDLLAVGANGTLLRSRTTPAGGLGFVAEPLPGGASTDLYAASALDRSGVMLVGGSAAGMFRSAGAGQAWAPVASGFPAGVTLRALALGSVSNVVAAAATPNMRWSPDAATWSVVKYPGGGGLVDLTFALAAGEGSSFGGVGIDGLVRWSVDGGLNWHQAPAPRPSFDLLGVAARGRDFVAVGEGGLVTRFSVDLGGLTGLADQNLPGVGTLNAVAATEFGWIAVGNQGRILVSDTGVVWTPLESGTIEHLLGVAYAPANAGSLGGIVLIVGDRGTLLAGVASPPQLNVAASSAAVCFTGLPENTPLLTASGFDSNTMAVDWFEGEVQVATNAPTFRPRVTAPGAYSYRAQARDLRVGATGPVSEPAAFEIRTPPATVQVNDPVRTNGVCRAAEVEYEAINPPRGGRVEWLNEQGNVLAAGVRFRPAEYGATAAGEYEYRARSIDADGCPSAEATPIALTLTALPDMPSVTEPARTNGVCNASAVEYVVANPPAGGQVEWLATNGLVLVTGPTFHPAEYGATNAGAYAFAVRALSAEGCASAGSTSISLILTALPQAPSIAEAVRTQEVCKAQTVVYTVSNPPEGGRVEWLGTNGIVLATGPTFRPADYGATNVGTHTFAARAVSVEGCAIATNTPVALTLIDCDPGLAIARVPEGTAVEITWKDATYVLERAAEVAGPWQLVPGAVSPYREVPVVGGVAFFRLRRL